MQRVPTIHPLFPRHDESDRHSPILASLVRGLSGLDYAIRPPVVHVPIPRNRFVGASYHQAPELLSHVAMRLAGVLPDAFQIISINYEPRVRVQERDINPLIHQHRTGVFATAAHVCLASALLGSNVAGLGCDRVTAYRSFGGVNSTINNCLRAFYDEYAPTAGVYARGPAHDVALDLVNFYAEARRMGLRLWFVQFWPVQLDQRTPITSAQAESYAAAFLESPHVNAEFILYAEAQDAGQAEAEAEGVRRFTEAVMRLRA